MDADPSAAAGTAAPLASMAMYDSGVVGSVYIKTGAADTAWQRIDVPEGQDWEITGNNLTGASPTAPDQYFGSLNDFDVAFKRNNVELMRIATAGILIGLNASLGGRLQVAVGNLGDELIKQIAPNGGSGSQPIHVTRMYKVQTTDATATTLADVAVPTDNVLRVDMRIVCRQSGGIAGAAGDGAAYDRFVHARNNSGTVTIRQTATPITSEDVNAFNVTTSVNGTSARFQVVGAANRNIAWVGHTSIMFIQN